MPKFEVTLQIFIRFPETHRAFSFKEYFFKNSWDIFLKNVHKISGLFVEFFFPRKSRHICFSKTKLLFQNSFELFTSLKINFLIQNKLFFFKITMEFPLFWNERIFVSLATDFKLAFCLNYLPFTGLTLPFVLASFQICFIFFINKKSEILVFFFFFWSHIIQISYWK